MKKKYFVLGYFGYYSNKLDGQTIKTRSLYKLLNDNIGSVDYFDTEILKKSKFNFIKLIFKLSVSRRLVYLPAQNNLKSFFPIVYFLSRVFRFKIHYFVVGGWLVNFLESNNFLISKLEKISMIYVETERMKRELKEKYNITNTVIIPNFRDNVQLSIEPNVNAKLKLVFMSRIHANKGIDMIIDFAKSTKLDVTIDFYGQISSEIEDYFLASVSEINIINYCGSLQPSEINSTLNKYDLLLLPTKFYTEGLPGAIVDAYFAGIPVIVTKWLHADEFVIHRQTGFIIPFENGDQEFHNYVEEIDMNRQLLSQLKINSLKESLKYTSEATWSVIEKTLNQ
ncbi:glycosyltransferase [Flavobacterium aciduliphilum]|uniref:Glycosyl transferase family 1 n=1 Tax=Flavobacterium aciduliphilum TaxID=1101402 RepID=A0A328YDR4_9FLAO|nr:glycosyltransferase [Flavobacterium aciduliphilum]RAR70242.1 glycosyl transferase family 1 [Flavobacterium aciduliphilum]